LGYFSLLKSYQTILRVLAENPFISEMTKQRQELRNENLHQRPTPHHPLSKGIKDNRNKNKTENKDNQQ
jgi:hypothetical protein